MKLWLWEESYWMLQVAVGAHDNRKDRVDVKYIVASKAWGRFDFLLGLGLGYLGTTSGNVSNPFCSYSDKFCSRDNSYKKADFIDARDMLHSPA